MLRIGLTGELGSGKSTVAAMMAAHGAHVFSSDALARRLMQPGQPLHAAIVAHFGPAVVGEDGALDRSRLAALAFDAAHPRIDELNALVHPAVIAEQAAELGELARTHPNAVAVIESALLASTPYGGALAERFDRIVLVTAPEEQKIAHFVERMAAERMAGGNGLTREALAADARRRLAVQHQTPQPPGCLVLHNDGTLADLQTQVDELWAELSTSVG